MSNPLLEFNSLPQFELIQAEHFLPAIEHILQDNRQQLTKIKQQYSQCVSPQLQTDLAQLDIRLNNAWSPISHLSSVMDDDDVRAAYKQVLPLVTEYSTEIMQDRQLYQLYKQLQADTCFSQLNGEDQRAVILIIKDFELSGIALPESEKQQYAQLQQQLSQLNQQFSEHVLDANANFYLHIEDEQQLEGVPNSAKGLLKQQAKQKSLSGFVITLDIPSYLPVMTYAKDRHIREQLHHAFVTRASDLTPVVEDRQKLDNTPLIEKILQTRKQMSSLLGYDCYAQQSLAKKMAESPEQVLNFLYEIAQKTYEQGLNEMQQLRDFARKKLGISQLQPWDIAYCSEHLKIEQYAIDKETIRAYFPVQNCLDGLFKTVKQLYDIDIKANNTVSVYHSDVLYFDVFDQGQLIAGFYLDLYARQGKRSGAWMNDCRARSLFEKKQQLPIAYLVCNFSAPTKDDVNTLTHDELTTLFHEFGHGLHHMLTSINNETISGINNVAWDAVELPSQFMENYCWQPQVLAYLSQHKHNKQPLPDDLLRQMLAAKNFQSAMFLLRQLEFALYDFSLHQQYDGENPQLIRQLLQQIREKISVVPVADYNQFQNSFSHIFAGGYAAGYYSYLWAEVLSADAFALFQQQGIFDRNLANRFRQRLLSQGGLKEAMQLFVDFAGRKPDTDALLKDRGII